ncbi:MAG: hypothetical protein KAG72_13345 [Abyssibacter sp.]|nr:hypothetical protein [Abyssibacter sp.]MCK5860329.1 hypothetical protein [Abyssibacter sp.]
MSAEVVLALLSALALVLFVALPLLPAILIYRIFPKTHVAASGSLGALTWNASGAFAAYFIVLTFIVLSPLNSLLGSISSFYSPSWTVEAEIHGYDSNSQPVVFDDVKVLLKPELHRVSSSRAVLRLPGLDRSEWPVVVFTTQGGAKDLNLASLADDEIVIDHAKKHVTVLKPVVLRQHPLTARPYPPPGPATRYLPEGATNGQ